MDSADTQSARLGPAAEITWPTSVKVGRWWFKNRSLSPIPFFLLMFFLPPSFYLLPQQAAVVALLILLCEGLRIWAVGYAGSSTRTRGDAVPRLIHSGPYRWFRNPLYVANIGLYTLSGVLFGFGWLSLFVFLYSVIQYNFIIRFEEQRLFEIFGEAYRRYYANVPRWPLWMVDSYSSSGHAFHLGQAIRSERSTLILIATVGIVYAIKRFVLA